MLIINNEFVSFESLSKVVMKEELFYAASKATQVFHAMVKPTMMVTNSYVREASKLITICCSTAFQIERSGLLTTLSLWIMDVDRAIVEPST